MQTLYEPNMKRYCICQSFYQEGSLMISCDGACKNWYHPVCIGMPEEKAKSMEGRAWFCDFCQKSVSTPTCFTPEQVELRHNNTSDFPSGGSATKR